MDEVVENVMASQWPELESRLNQGEPIILGAVRVDWQGIQHEGKRLTWPEITKVQTSPHLRITTVDQTVDWHHVSRRDLLNLLLIRAAIVKYTGLEVR